MDEVDWINPIVIQSKKGINEIWFCIDFRVLKFACLYDPFLTPFSDEVLD